MQYHGYLDRFTVIGQCVVLDGWANQRDLSLWYGGSELPLIAAQVDRPDLVPAFGEDAAGWGFTACGTLPTRDVDASKFRLRFNAGLILDDPAKLFARAEDVRFIEMRGRFQKTVAQNGGSLLEIGSRARSGATYREWFPPDINYVGIDVTSGPNVDVVGDAHHLSRCLLQKFDYIFSMAVFEHILMPWKVALEMNKVLVDGGQALIISHGAWPLHEEPWDFFRFSKESWSGIFNAHTGFEILDAQYQYRASLVPDYINNPIVSNMSLGSTYLLSGCLVQSTGPAKVAWDADVGEVYDLHYSHA